MQSSTNEIEVLVAELQKKFDRLKVLYEQFFMGIERVEPLVLRKEITRAVIGLTGIHLRSPSLRFKVSTFIQKWNIYQSHWNRVMREIEAGRYVRHVVTARRRAEREGLPFPAEEMGLAPPVHSVEEVHPTAEDPGAAAREPGAPPAPPGRPGQLAAAGAAAPAAGRPAPVVPGQPSSVRAPTTSSVSLPMPGTPAGSTPPAGRSPGRALVPGMADSEVQTLYQRVVTAQRAAGETGEIRFDTLVAQLNRQVPKLMTEYSCDEIQFDVVNRDGKVRLKPSPKKP